MMTNERIAKITEALGTDEQHIEALVRMTPEAAAAELMKEGFTVTAEELIDYGNAVKSMVGENGEIDEAKLENVAGGCLVCTAFSVVFHIIKSVW